MRFFPLILFFCSIQAQALTFDGKGDLSLTGEYRTFPQSGLGPYDHAWESIFKGNYQAKIIHSDFRLELTPELRGLNSRVLSLPSNSIGYATVRGPRRLMSLGLNVVNYSQAQWVLDFERLNFVGRLGELEIQVGRKPVGVGTLKVLPVWNKFSRPLPNTAGPNLIFGQDSATLRWQKEELSIQTIDIEGRDARSKDAVHWLEGILYDPNLEIHGMASRWWENNTLGLALAKDVGGATLRAEGLWIGFDKSYPSKQAQAGLGLEYALNETWTLLGEGIYLEAGANSSSKYPLIIGSRFRPLRAKGYTYLQAAAQLSSFWNLNLASLVNLVDGSIYPMIKLTHSLSDNCELTLAGQFPIGSAGTEFSKKIFQYPTLPPGEFIGAPSQFSAQVSTSLWVFAGSRSAWSGRE